MRRWLVVGACMATTVAWSAPGEAATGGAGGPVSMTSAREGGGTPYVRATRPKARRPGLRRARTPKRRPARRHVGAADLGIETHRFPLAGPFDFGGPDARFGARRGDRAHQGQDLTAIEGTPVVAPRGGFVAAVRYQAHGGGHYVVIESAEEQRDYVFMHLRAGSVPVREGQRVRAGQRIGEVGSSGRSSGAHLHFEVWEAPGWLGRGRPVDPLPLLRAWARPG